MKISNTAAAQIPESKLTQYLLSSTHPVGRAKAAFFVSLGFDPNRVGDLRSALLPMAGNDVEAVEQSIFGKKYLVRGSISGPNGRSADILSVWIVREGTDIPTLVTAYPES